MKYGQKIVVHLNKGYSINIIIKKKKKKKQKQRLENVLDGHAGQIKHVIHRY